MEQGIYLGDENAGVNRRLSQVPQISLTIPPPKPPRTDLNVLREIQEKQLKEQGSPIDITSDTTEKSEKLGKPSTSEAHNKPGCSIIRSVSDYKTNELASEIQSKIKKSRTNIFHNSPGFIFLQFLIFQFLNFRFLGFGYL